MRMKAHRLGPIGFTRAHPSPVFISGAIQGGILRPKVSSDQGDNAISTMHHLDLQSILVGEQDEPVIDGVEFGAKRFIEIESEGQEDGHWISIGRTVNSDVVVNDYTVSKIHARVAKRTHLGHWVLEEMGSTNGTKMDAMRLDGGMEHKLSSGVCIVFGRVELTFMDSKGFYEFLIR